MTREQLEIALDRGQLQMQGNGGRWYDVRRNGATKTWKRQPGKVEIPCKVGFKEAFRLHGQRIALIWNWGYAVRVRPDNFDPRKRI
jgi:hypothetical protein